MWVKLRIPLPARFSELMSGQYFLDLMKERVSKVDAVLDNAMAPGGSSVCVPPGELAPSGATICSFYNYGTCTKGDECGWDHAHCHKCKSLGHAAKDCDKLYPTTTFYVPDEKSRIAVLHEYLHKFA